MNPRLVYCAVSGFGGTGPYAPRGGYDLIAQGMSGIMSVTGDEDGAPAKSGVPLSDLSAGASSPPTASSAPWSIVTAPARGSSWTPHSWKRPWR